MRINAQVRDTIRLLLKKGIDCPNCGTRILGRSLICGKCGYVLRPFPVVIGALIIVAILSLVVSLAVILR